MRKFILSSIWMVVAAMPTLNAQQASPNQTTATQQNSKPKAAPNRALPQPRVQPTQATNANNNPGQKNPVANNPGFGKPVGNNPGHGKPAVNNAGNGKTSVNRSGKLEDKTITQTLSAATGMSGMTKIGGNNTISLSYWSEADTIFRTRDIGIRRGDTISTTSDTTTTDQFTPMAICCLTR